MLPPIAESPIAGSPIAGSPAPTPRGALVEVALGTALAAAGIALVELGSGLLPGAGAWAGAAVAAVFLGLPLVFARLRGFAGDPLGIGRAPLLPGVALGVATMVLIAGPFVLGYDVLATRVLSQTRFAGPGLLSFGAAFQGTPPPAPGQVAIWEEGHGLAVRNQGSTPLVLTLGEAGSPGAERLILRPNRRLVLPAQAAAAWSLRRQDGGVIDAEMVRLGGALSPLGAAAGVGGAAIEVAPAGIEFRLPRSYGWLLWALLTQLLVVALPEEAFFRGWVLGRLRQAWPPPRRQVLGVPFGTAHVVSALLFALIHLVVTPSPGRLLVFFPGLLFAWLAERSRAIVAPTVSHALSNVLLRVATRTYL